jgi:hypothetical protein
MNTGMHLYRFQRRWSGQVDGEPCGVQFRVIGGALDRPGQETADNMAAE